MSKRQSKYEKIKQENEIIQKYVDAICGILIIAIIVCLINHGGVDDAIRCKRTNNDKWCNKYQLEEEK